MKTTEALVKFNEVKDAAADEDAMFVVFFSKEDDRFDGFSAGMDAGDALILIDQLIEQFGLNRAAIAA